MEEEIWKLIPFDSRYSCSNMGVVRAEPRMVRAKNGKTVPFNKPYRHLAYRKRSTGYHVDVGKEERKSYPVDYLTYLSHKGEVPRGFLIKHLDGNPFNNRIGNLKAVDVYEYNDISMENFVPIKDYPLYVINPSGVVINVETGNNVSHVKSKSNKCLAVRLWKNNTTKLFYLYRLLAIHFIPNPMNKPQVNHKNGNRWDLSIDNMEWCTAYENMRHAYDNGLTAGTFKAGFAHQFLKFHKDVVRDMISDKRAGMKLLEIGEKYKINWNYASKLIIKYEHILAK